MLQSSSYTYIVQTHENISYLISSYNYYYKNSSGTPLPESFYQMLTLGVRHGFRTETSLPLIQGYPTIPYYINWVC